MEDNTSPQHDALTATQSPALPSARDYSLIMATQDYVRAKWHHAFIFQLAIGLCAVVSYLFFTSNKQEVVGLILIGQAFFVFKTLADVYEQYKSTRSQRHLAMLEHATMDVRDDALIPKMTFLQTVGARMAFAWRENKTRIAIACVLIPSLSAVLVLSLGGQWWAALLMAIFWLMVFAVVITAMVSWEIVFPPQDTRKQLDTEILLARKRMAHHDLQGALSSPGMDSQKRGALSESDQKEGGLTPLE